MKNGIVWRLILFLGIYFGLQQYGGIWGYRIMYPIKLLVTFLHEFGHALGALITGGSVLEINISENGAGYTKSMGGNRSIILMGGYLGSALLGNLIFLIGARFKAMVKPMIFILGAVMIFTAFYWFTDMFTSGVLVLFALGCYLSFRSSFGDELLMFLGLATVLYIIQDFNVGPTSDLNAYAKLMVFLPASAWMYIWLIVAVVMFIFNLRIALKTTKKKDVGETNYPGDFPTL